MTLDEEKLTYMSTSSEFIYLLKGIPLKNYLESIILTDVDEFTITPDKDKSLEGHIMRIFLDKEICPPIIYVHINNKFAAQYSYHDEIFAQRSNLDIDD